MEYVCPMAVYKNIIIIEFSEMVQFSVGGGPTASGPHSLAFIMQWSALQAIKHPCHSEPSRGTSFSLPSFFHYLNRGIGKAVGIAVGPSQAQGDTYGLGSILPTASCPHSLDLRNNGVLTKP